MALFLMRKVYREITDPATGDLLDLVVVVVVAVTAILCVNVRSRRGYSRRRTMQTWLAWNLDSKFLRFPRRAAQFCMS